MLSKRKPGIGSTAAIGLVRDPAIRSAAADAAPPVARLGLNVTKRLAQRRARRRMKRIAETFSAVSTLVSTVGPQIARQLGIVEPPKPSRTAPKVATGAVIGAGAMYLLEPGAGREHRRRVKQLIAH